MSEVVVVKGVVLSLLDAQKKANYLSHRPECAAEAVECRDAINRLLDRLLEKERNNG